MQFFTAVTSVFNCVQMELSHFEASTVGRELTPLYVEVHPVALGSFIQAFSTSMSTLDTASPPRDVGSDPAVP